MAEEEDFEALDRLIEAEAKEKKGKNIYCSRCGSKDITYYIGQYLGSLYQCKECGHVDNFIIEDGLLGEKIREEYLKKQKG
ncbi:MAG: hypothetical protein QXQ02_07050 [Halobacteria archaeon]